MGYDKYTCVLLIYGWCHYFYEVFIIFVFGCPELKPSRVNNIGVLIVNLIIIDHSRMIQAFRFIEISKYDNDGQVMSATKLCLEAVHPQSPGYVFHC